MKRNECYYLETQELHCDREPGINMEVDLILNSTNKIKTVTISMCERHWLEFDYRKGKGFSFWDSPNNNNCIVKDYRADE